MPINEVAQKEGVILDVEELYNDARLAMITGWSLEYIRGLGVLDGAAILQINEVDHLPTKKRK